MNALRDIVARCEAGEISAPMALMEMLVEVEDEAVVEASLAALSPSSPAATAIAALQREHDAGCARVAAMLRSDVDRPPKNASVEEGIAFCARLFDWSVTESEEASVALYSLGSRALLAAATREIADLLAREGLLGREKIALDIGCGIGRLEEALAGELGAMTAIDVSAKMIAAAKRRTSLANVTFAQTDGVDLARFSDRSFDLVFAVDSFPYLVQAGMALVATHVREAARVLRPGGDFLVLNFSYRADLGADRADVGALAQASNLDLVVNGATPFSLWNGAVFHLRRRSG